MFKFSPLSVLTLFFLPALLSAQVGGLVDYWKFDCNVNDSATWDGGATGCLLGRDGGCPPTYDTGGTNGTPPTNYDNSASLNFASEDAIATIPQSLDGLTGLTISFRMNASAFCFTDDRRSVSGG